MRQRRGTTLVEQLLILVVVGVVASLAFYGVSRVLDNVAVRAAAREIRDVFSTAREHAVASGVRTAVEIDPVRAELVAHAGVDTIARRPVGQLHKVTLQTSRDSMAYAPSGLGYGASNLSIVVVRNASADTIAVSRLGRVR